MKNYQSKLDRATRLAKNDFPNATPAELKRVIRQYLAKFIVGMDTTIGSKRNAEGKMEFYLDKKNPLTKPKLP